MNVATLVAKSAVLFPHRKALLCAEKEYTYSEFAARVSRVASGLLELGLVPGDRVALYLGNRSEFLESLFGIFWASLVAVPINTKLHPKEVSQILADCRARVLIFDEHDDLSVNSLQAQAPSVKHCFQVPDDAAAARSYRRLPENSAPVAVAEVKPDELAWLFYTSGTTGKSKGAILSHRNLLAMTMSFFADMSPLEPNDTFIHIGPLTHGSGLYSLPPLARGCANVILPLGGFNPRTVLEAGERHKATHTFVVPTVLKRLTDSALESGIRPSNFKTVIYGGSSMHLEDLKRSIRVFGTQLVQLYGQGESPMTISYLPGRDHVYGRDPRVQEKLTSAGVPRTDVEVRVVDTEDRPVDSGVMGEIIVRGEVVMQGYWQNSTASAETLRNGWLHTGDLGKFDAEGYLYVLDRLKDMIITGGANVYAREVEDVILRHPAVAEVAVIGVPDRDLGEAIKALVVLRTNARATIQEITSLCRRDLAGYKKPRFVEFVEGLPRNAYGKVLKRELRQGHRPAAPSGRQSPSNSFSRV